MGWQAKPRWDGRRWRVKLRGKIYHLGKTESEAWQRFLALHKRVMGADPAIPQPDTVAGLITAYVTATSANKWTTDILSLWDRFAGMGWTDELQADCLVRFADWCRQQRNPKTGEHWSPYTVKHAVSAATTCCQWAHRHELIDKLPDRPKLDPTGYRPRDLAPDKLRATLDALAAPKRGHVAPLIRFIALTGCRPSEARQLRWEQIRLDQRICVITEHKTQRKSRGVKTRTIYLPIEAVELLKARGPASEGVVFLSRLGKPYSKDGLAAICRRMGFSPYQLRHTAAQSLVNQGVGLDDVGKLLGHRSADTTRRYAQVRDARAIAVLDNHASPVQLALSALAPPATSDESAAHTSPRSEPRRRARAGTPRRRRRSKGGG